MNLEVLVSTMNQNDCSLLNKMNIKTDVIVVNQCERNEIEEFEYNGNCVKWLSLNERGVGLSRNTALMRSNADIVLFADDDVVYEDDYENKVISAFEKYPDADIIVFNFVSNNILRPDIVVEKGHRIRWYNSLKYGTFRIAIKRKSCFYYNLFFSHLFGGGAKYQAGEDNLYLINAIQKGLKIMASSSFLGCVNHGESTWFKGYNEKYYKDCGALFYAMFKRKALPILVLFELKTVRNKKGVPFLKRIKLESEGIREYKREMGI